MSALIKRSSVGCPADSEYLVDCRLAVMADQPDVECASPEDEADYIVRQAQEHSARLVAEAQAQAESIRADAYAAGCEAAAQEVAETTARLAQLQSDIEEDAARQVAEFWVDIEPELVRLAVEIAKKVTRREIAEDDSFLLDSVKAGLHQLSDRRELKIRVNSSDSAYVRGRKDDLLTSFDGISSLEIIEDRRVSDGGWIVESASGRLDGRVESQLSEIEKALLEAVGDAGS